MNQNNLLLGKVKFILNLQVRILPKIKRHPLESLSIFSDILDKNNYQLQSKEIKKKDKKKTQQKFTYKNCQNTTFAYFSGNVNISSSTRQIAR